MSESLLSETWQFPVFPVIFVGKQAVSIFRN